MANRSRACAARSARSTASARRAAREDEPEIAGALRQRHQQLIRLRGDPHVVDAGDARAPPRARHAAIARRARGIGIIITPDARGSRDQPSGDSPSAWRSSSSSSENGIVRLVSGSRRLDRDLLEPQRARAQAADRARGDFEDEHAAVVDAALGVDRAVLQADGRGRRARPLRRSALPTSAGTDDGVT